MLLITLRARRNDPIKAETIVKYLDSYINKAKIIEKKMIEEITYKNPAITGPYVYYTHGEKDGFFKHESENVHFALEANLFYSNKMKYDQAHLQCVDIFLEKSGVHRSISSWTSAKKSWAQSA